MPIEFDKLACVAYSIKKGTAPKWTSKGARELASKNSLEQLKEWCKRAHK